MYTPANTITCSSTTTTNGFPLAIVYASEDSTRTNVVSSVVPTLSMIVLNSEITALLLVPENAGIMLISRLTGRNIALMMNKICDRQHTACQHNRKRRHNQIKNQEEHG